MSKSPLTLQMPSPPDPVPVVLNPGTTALLIFDVIDHICAHRPKCKEQMVPAIASLLAQARKSGATIVYGGDNNKPLGRIMRVLTRRTGQAENASKDRPAATVAKRLRRDENCMARQIAASIRSHARLYPVV
jgi:hypothetical protein